MTFLLCHVNHKTQLKTFKDSKIIFKYFFLCKKLPLVVHTLEITVLEGDLGNCRLEKSHFDPCVDGMYFNFGLKLCFQDQD